MSSSATGKRYCDLPGVKLARANIPASLRPLLDFAKEWAIVGDNALERAIRKAPPEEIRRVVEMAQPLKQEIWKFAYESEGAKATPVPDEVVVFQMFAWGLNHLEVEAQ